MNYDQAIQLFERALQDGLTAAEQAEFDRALAADAELAARFEAFADASSGLELSGIHAWLTQAGISAERPAADPVLLRAVADAAHQRRRGRLIRLVAGAAAVAAAAAIAVLVALPRAPAPVEPAGPTGWPTAALQGVTTLPEDTLYNRDTWREVSPATGVSVRVERETVFRPVREGTRLIEGALSVQLQAGAQFEVHAGNHRVVATGPAEFEVRVESDAFHQFHQPEEKHMRNEMIARLGAVALAVTVTAFSGQVDVHGQNAPRELQRGKPATFQADGERRAPPTAEDAFKRLDKNSDGKIDKEEAPEGMMDRADANKDGGIDLEEFKAHFQARERRGPPQPPSAEDAFKRLDKNSDGKLDKEEAPERMLKDFDDNKDGSIDLEEFKKHHRAAPEGRERPAPANAEDEFKRLDKNSDGKLDKDEAPEGLMGRADDNKDGSIDAEEFKKHFRPQPGRGPEGRDRREPPKAEDVFKNLDKNSDGKLDKEEAPDGLMGRADDNKDGVIDLEEFKKHHRNPPPREGRGPRGEGEGDARPPREGPRGPRGEGEDRPGPRGDGPRGPRPERR